MKEHLQKMLAAAVGQGPDALMLAGAAAIAFGAHLVYPPAGWIVAGGFAIGIGLVWAGSRK